MPINKTVLTGRLVRDPVIRKTTSGRSVCNFTVASDRNVKKDDNKPDQQTTDFLNCIVWNQPADFLCKYGRKGSWIEIEGRNTSRSYTNREGQKIYVQEISVDHLELPRTSSDKPETTTAEPQKELERESHSEQPERPTQAKEPAYTQQSADRMNWDGDHDPEDPGISEDDLPF